MKELTLSSSIRIPFDKYNGIKPAATVTEEKKENETDEELFARTYEKLDAQLEALTAIEMAKIMRIQNNGGLINYAMKLADDLGIGNNRFKEAYLNLIKKESE